MILEVWADRATWNEIPYKFEAGTMNIAQAIGMGAAIEYLEGLGMEAVRAHEVELTGYALRTLTTRFGPDITIYGPSEPAERGGVISFAYKDIHPHDLAELCDRERVCIRAGHHCAQPLMRRLGLTATSRASFAIHTTTEDVDRLVDGLERVRSVFA